MANAIDNDSDSDLSIVQDEDLQFFDNQVAGHQYIDGKQAFFKCRDGSLLKIFQSLRRGQQEINFYRKMFSISQHIDPISYCFRKFMPTYYGTVKLKNNEIPQLYLKISDVTHQFTKPCVIDLKIGSRTYDHLANEAKIARAIKKYPMQEKIGFRIGGMKVYNTYTKLYMSYDKLFGRELSESNITEGLLQFFPKDIDWRHKLIDSIITKLEELLAWFKIQDRWMFFSSSLLIIYDSYQENYVVTDIRMIDFTHTYEVSSVKLMADKDFRDENTLYGLNNVLMYLQKIKFAN